MLCELSKCLAVAYCALSPAGLWSASRIDITSQVKSSAFRNQVMNRFVHSKICHLLKKFPGHLTSRTHFQMQAWYAAKIGLKIRVLSGRTLCGLPSPALQLFLYIPKLSLSFIWMKKVRLSCLSNSSLHCFTQHGLYFCSSSGSKNVFGSI